MRVHPRDVVNNCEGGAVLAFCVIAQDTTEHEYSPARVFLHLIVMANGFETNWCEIVAWASTTCQCVPAHSLALLYEPA
jgi:hypothetical protein